MRYTYAACPASWPVRKTYRYFRFGSTPTAEYAVNPGRITP
jgi:hypothetical protein